MTDIRVCTLTELHSRRVISFDLGRNPAGRPLRGLVVLDEQEHVRAYQDLCRHLPVFLDASDRFLSDDKMHLVCMTHGAHYRVRDGYCVEGPCQGKSLFALPVRVLNDDIWVSWSPTT